MTTLVYDLAVIGGGINGCGIARDAAGRGLSVFLCEQNDLASATSSASTKLIHGGLRYLEYYEFRLVREALTEREVLLHNAPHIIWPLRFILPHHKDLRPAWLIRLGLLLYDYIGGRKELPPAKTLDLQQDIAGKCLQNDYDKGFEYSDCWVVDTRLAILNAVDAAARGCMINTQTELLAARRDQQYWTLSLFDRKKQVEYTIKAKALVNASGPWLNRTMDVIDHCATREHIRMVKGSHIIVKKLFDHERAYIFQNRDGRIVFAIPYEKEFTLIGTTDVDFEGDPGVVTISEQETEYLCSAASGYFKTQLSAGDVVSSFSGIRPLFDDGKDDAKAATRDYVLKIDSGEEGNSPPLLALYGGKITTYRKLAESVLAKLGFWFPGLKGPWTEHAPLPGGDFQPHQFDSEVQAVMTHHPFITKELAVRLVRLYGTVWRRMLDAIPGPEEMGPHFGHDLYGFEVDYLVAHEWAECAEDILWRRTRLGLFFTDGEIARLEDYVTQRQ